MRKLYQKRSDFALEMLTKYAKMAPTNIISDVGAGFGMMEEHVKAVGGIWQPFDYYKKMERSIIWDLNNSYPAECKKAGIILFLEVLEHLSNPQLGIKHLSEHLEKGGYIILTTPSPQSAQNRFSLLTKGVLYAFQPKHLPEHHVFTPWEHIVQHFMEEEGFEMLEWFRVDPPKHTLMTLNPKVLVLHSIYRIIEWLNPLSKGLSYGLVARKK